LRPDGTGFTVAAGVTDANSDIVDMAGFDAVRFITGYGAITAGALTSQKVQQGAQPNLADAADLAGSGVTVADTDDNKLVIQDLIRPNERYLRVAYDRGTQNAAIDFLIAELYRAGSEPVTQDATVATAETHVSPFEGMA
jgi:hypothetical protein